MYPAPPPRSGIPLASRGTAAALLILAVSVLFTQFWEADLYDDPILYASIARRMAETGEWLEPHWGPDRYFRKPPLMLWLTALSFRVVGVSRAAAVFWSPALAVGAVLLTFALARRWFGDWTALWAAVILTTTYRFVKDSATLRLDGPLTFFVLGAFLAAFAAARHRPRLHLVAGLCIGLAILTKGPAGLLGLAPYLFLAWLRLGARPVPDEPAAWWRCAEAWVGLALGVALPAAWYGAQWLRHGDAFLRVALLAEGAQRLSQDQAGSDPWTYTRALLHYYWPWLPFLGWGAVLYVRQLRREGWRSEAAFPAAFVLAYLALLAVSATKHYRYLQPAYPLLAMVSAMGPAAWLEPRRRAMMVRTVAGLGVCIGLAGSLLPVRLHRDRNGGIAAVARDLAAAGGSKWEIAVSPGAADHNVLSALLYHGDLQPQELRARYFQAPPPPGPCVDLIWAAGEEVALAEAWSLEPVRPFRNDHRQLVLGRACRRGS